MTTWEEAWPVLQRHWDLWAEQAGEDDRREFAEMLAPYELKDIAVAARVVSRQLGPFSSPDFARMADSCAAMHGDLRDPMQLATVRRHMPEEMRECLRLMDEAVAQGVLADPRRFNSIALLCRAEAVARKARDEARRAAHRPWLNVRERTQAAGAAEAAAIALQHIRRTIRKETEYEQVQSSP